MKKRIMTVSNILIFCLSLNFIFCSTTVVKSKLESNNPDVTPPKLLHQTDPIYPSAALKNEITGTVYVKILVDTLGVVTEAELIPDKGTNVDIFGESAIQAAYKTKWEPAKSNNKPFATRIVYKIDFNLK